ncbi:MAG: cupin domain-containing protein [Candidatus Zixiibacteriota bacterium]
MAMYSAITRRKPGRGKVYSVLGDHVACKLVGEECGDAISVFEVTVAPHSGPPPHVHLHEEEAYYVLQGSFDFLQGERIIHAKPGEFIRFARRTMHTYKNTGDMPGRLLAIYTPSGVEHYFEEMDRLTRAQALDAERAQKVANRHAILSFPL